MGVIVRISQELESKLGNGADWRQDPLCDEFENVLERHCVQLRPLKGPDEAARSYVTFAEDDDVPVNETKLAQDLWRCRGVEAVWGEGETPGTEWTRAPKGPSR